MVKLKKTIITEILNEALPSLSKAPFLCTLHSTWFGNEKLILHYSTVKVSNSKKQLNSEVRAKFRKLQLTGLRHRIQFHSDHGLQRRQSFEALLQKTFRGTIVYDPTGAFGAAQSIHQFVKSVRNETRNLIVGAYWSVRTRTLFFLADASLLDAINFGTKSLANVEATIVTLLKKAMAKDPSSANIPIRMCFQLPTDHYIAVDDHSTPQAAQMYRAPVSGVRKQSLAFLFGVTGLTAANATHLDQTIHNTAIPHGAPANVARSYAGGTGLHDVWRSTSTSNENGSAIAHDDKNKSSLMTDLDITLFGTTQKELLQNGIDLHWIGANASQWGHRDQVYSGYLTRSLVRSRQLPPTTEPSISSLPGLVQLVSRSITSEDYGRIQEQLDREFGVAPSSLHRKYETLRRRAYPWSSQLQFAQADFWDWLKKEKNKDSTDSRQSPNNSDSNRDRATRRWSSSD
jgi:hypothetical protein